MQCPNCGFETSPSLRTCPRCKHDIASAPPVNTPSSFKVCPQCQTKCGLAFMHCLTCGHNFRQNFASPPPSFSNLPPQNSNPVGSTQAFFAQVSPQSVPQLDFGELARRYRESQKLCAATFWIGLFCLWPVWIVTYLEFTKMRQIKDDIAAKGADVRGWQNFYGLKDFL